MIPKTEDGRVLFAVPWHDKVVIGTTDTAIDTISFEPRPLEEEISFVLHHANKYFKKNIQRSDVKSMFAGLRPLVKPKDAQSTSVISRDHIIIVAPSGLITITGGKWTTYRKMAEDVIDHAVITGKLPQRTCITKDMAIGLQDDAYTHINGDNALHRGATLSEKEIEYFVKHEMAQTVEDILARRTRLLFLDAAAAIERCYETAALMARFMDKGEDWIKKQVEEFNAVAKNYLP